jgi:hypothetical protein
MPQERASGTPAVPSPIIPASFRAFPWLGLRPNYGMGTTFAWLK